MKKELRIMNIVAAVMTLIFVTGFFTLNVSELITYCNTLGKVYISLAAILVCFILYLGSIIQGLRSISNGRAGTMKNAAVWQLLLTLPNIIADLALKYANRNTTIAFTKKQLSFFMIVFIILIVLSILRILMTKGAENEAQMDAGSPKTARRIILICVAAPAAIFTLVVGIGKFLASHPMVQHTLVGIFIVAILAPFVLLFVGIVKGASALGFGESSGDTMDNSVSRRPAAAPRRVKTEKPDVSGIVKELEDEYAYEYKRITGSYPWYKDFMILKEGPEKEAVRKLQNRMRIKAKKMGAAGKNKWF